jgi:eukaryotic-like serine/threonine-protein kinase
MVHSHLSMEQPPKFGKYEVVGKIGVGGFGEVYKGRDPYIKRLVAIKTCTSDDDNIRSRFFREAEIAGNLHHRHITTIYDFGIEAELPYLVQEFLTGEDLDGIVARREQIPLPQKLRHLLQVARGLEYAESQGVVHRDIKPANIRILADGTAKIMDFGIAKLLHQESGLTRTGMTVGTAAYLAPEQVKGEAVDHRTDIFSFGVLSYELITGARPFQGQTFSAVLYQILTDEPAPVPALCAHCPPKLTRLIEKCMEKDPANRPEGFAEVVQTLSQLSRELPIEAEMESTAEIPTRRGASPASSTAATKAAETTEPETPSDSSLAETMVTDLRLRRTEPDVTLQLDTASMRSQEATLEQPTLAAPTGEPLAGPGSPRPKSSSKAPWGVRFAVLGLLAVAGGAWYLLGAGRSASPSSAPPTAEETVATLEPEAVDEPAQAEETAAVPSAADAPTLANVPPPPPKPATLVATRSWNDQIVVALDGETPRPLTRERSWEVQPGAHTLVYTLQTLEYSATEEVRIEVGEGTVHRIEQPIAEPGSLTVQAFPGSPQGEVRIAGEAAGATPFARKLAPGSYGIEVVGPEGSNYTSMTREVGITSGGRAIITFDLTGRRAPVVLEQPRTES